MTQQTYTPDWSKAPTDANWHARDSDGCGFWYNKRPAPSRGFWAAGCSLTIADNDCPILDHDAALDNWRDTLTVRPFQDRDIPQNLSDYFSGKTPFITAYVDLLLARMAKEERFSEAVCVKKSQDIKANDVVVFRAGNVGNVWTYAVVVQAFEDHIYINHIIDKHDDDLLVPQNCFYVETDIVAVRTITELEAVEFRAATEAVYG